MINKQREICISKKNSINAFSLIFKEFKEVWGILFLLMYACECSILYNEDRHFTSIYLFYFSKAYTGSQRYGFSHSIIKFIIVFY